MFFVLVGFLGLFGPSDPPPLKTQTEKNRDADEMCCMNIIELCVQKLCPDFCLYQYGKPHPHTKDMPYKECLARCTPEEECKIDTSPTLSTLLSEQLKTMRMKCFQDELTSKNTDEGKEPWRDVKAAGWKNVEKARAQKDGEEKEGKN